MGPRLGFYPRVYPYYVPYGGVAYQEERGFSDGHSRGKEDARHGRPYDPNSHSHYRNANSLAYRDAFLRGYSEGFRDYAG